MTTPLEPNRDYWIARARSAPIEDELERRDTKLRGKIERVGPCPKCGGDDRFSINTAKQVFNCRGCGARGDVIDLVQWLDGSDFPTACTTLAGEQPKPIKLNGNGKDHAPEPIKECVESFEYVDPSGALLFVADRFHYRNADGSLVLKDGKPKKTFSQKRPDPDEQAKNEALRTHLARQQLSYTPPVEHWIYNVDGVRVVPYRLPELIEAIASDHFILIVEGEAKVELLRSWNVPATCNAAGAGKWKPEHSEFLRGADVVILPDNDEPGRDHADVVGASLLGIAKSVRVVELPGLPAKGDVIDWAAAGGTVELLHHQIAQAKPWMPRERPAENKPAAISMAMVAPQTIGKALPEGVSIDDFRAYMPLHNFIFVPSREPWPAASVNSRLGKVPLFDADGKPKLNDEGEQETIAASTWLDQNRPVEQATWAPGLPMLIEGRLIADGGWIERPKVTCLNLYRPPKIIAGNAAQAGPWLDHVRKVFGDDADHIIKWLAHRVQHPADKINHALVLGGKQGIGKDTTLEPIKHAIGPWNFIEVTPQQMLGRFNGFAKSVILRISEARDLGDINRYQFYDHTKAYTAAPPDVLRVDEKNLREHAVLNCCGVIFTTNHKSDGIYLPPDDRRHFVAWSPLDKEDFAEGYWHSLWGWYGRGGYGHVAAYLAELDICEFDPKAPPLKTAAFWSIVDASRAPEDAELADVLDRLGNPNVITLARVQAQAEGEFALWIRDRKNRRAIPHRFEQCGYVPVRNDTNKRGEWIVDGVRQTVYAKEELPLRDQLRAASDLTR